VSPHLYKKRKGGPATYDAVFGGMKELITADMFDASYREYHPTQGRWITPDPAGLSAADPTNPQSWNRYAYVLNNPPSATDPTGLWCVWEDGTHDHTESNGGASEGDCVSQGGHWDQYNTITGIFQQNGIVTQINTIFDSVNNRGPCTTTDCGAGATLENFDQTLQTYSQGDVPTPDVSVDPQGVIRQVGIETGGFTKQVNCAAAAAYPFLPGPKPDDINGLLTDSAAGALDSAASASEASAEALKRAYRLGQGKSALQRSTAKLADRAKLLGGAAKLVEAYGYVTAAQEGIKNFRECENGR
jgi:RHS repeat-associated protein